MSRRSLVILPCSGNLSFRQRVLENKRLAAGVMRRTVEPPKLELWVIDQPKQPEGMGY